MTPACTGALARVGGTYHASARWTECCALASRRTYMLRTSMRRFSRLLRNSTLQPLAFSTVAAISALGVQPSVARADTASLAADAARTIAAAVTGDPGGPRASAGLPNLD